MDLKISVRNVRAIAHADIDISGITVLSGINGCGKSTISRFLYELLFGALKYNELVDEDSAVKLRSMAQSVFSAVTNLSGILSKAESRKISDLLVRVAFAHARVEETRKVLVSTLDYLDSWFSGREKPFSEAQQALVKSAASILSSIARDTSRQGMENSLAEIADSVRAEIDRLSEEAIETKSARSVGVFQKFWAERFGKGLEPRAFSVLENGIPICDTERNVIALPDSVKRVFYIDSPMAFGENRSRRDYWLALNRALVPTGELSPMFSYGGDGNEGILGGTFEWNDGKTDISYRLPDGQSFEMFSNGATGLKSFTMVQGLYRNGLVDSKTMLIMDEPEAHLHPQWIVRFARLLVLLRKETGCKLFISSHSTDLVSSIKYISEKELGASPSFYLAEQENSEKYAYSFRALGDDIEPIFETFNRSFKLENIFSGVEDGDEV